MRDRWDHAKGAIFRQPGRNVRVGCTVDLRGACGKDRMHHGRHDAGNNIIFSPPFDCIKKVTASGSQATIQVLNIVIRNNLKSRLEPINSERIIPGVITLVEDYTFI